MGELEAKGRAEGKAALIKAMLASGMSVETLAGATGMSTEEIQKIVNAEAS